MLKTASFKPVNMKRIQHTSLLYSHFLIFFALLSVHLKKDRAPVLVQPVTEITTSCEEPVIQSITKSTDSICSGDRVFLRVTGALNDASNWYWYTGKCGAEQPIAVGSFITVTPDTTTTYYMRGEGECFPNGLECQTITVTVIDSIAPTVSCIGDQIGRVDENCEFIVPDYRILVVAADNCVDEVRLEQTPAPNTVISENTEVAIVAWDKNNNSDTCSFRLLLTDPFPPVVNCKDATIYLTEETNLAYLEPRMIDGGVFDACGDIKLRANKSTFDCTQLGDHSVELTVEDKVGNILICEATVTVKDTLSPEAVCGENIQISLNDEGQGTLTAEEVGGNSLDNCGVDLLQIDRQSFTCTDLGVQNILLTVTDVSGNTATCVAQVTVKDDQLPVVNGKNIEIALNEQGVATIVAADVNNESWDNCGLEELWLSRSQFDCSQLGENTIQLYASDQAGNENNTTVIVTVIDPIPPVLDCGGTRNIVLTAGCTVELPDYTAQVSLTDNCSNARIIEQLPAPGTPIQGSTRVTIRAEDAFGNGVSCSFTVIVQDQSLPEISCLDAQTTPLINNCEGVVGDYTGMIDINDNCGSEELAVFQIPAPGTVITEDVEVRIVVVDAALNEAECRFDLILEDKEAPDIECPGDQEVILAEGCDVAVPDFLSQINVTDACPEGLELTQSPTAGTPVTENTQVIITAKDQAGNENSCTFNLMVKDNINPTLTCNNVIFINIEENGIAELTPDRFASLATDNCSATPETGLRVDVSKRFFTCSDIGFNKITLSAMDAAGNEASCMIRIGVIASDNCPPPAIANSDDDMDLTNLPEETDIGDPCSCLGEGRFSEQVVIGPSKAGQGWEVATTSLRSLETEAAYSAGTAFTEIPYRNDSSLYVLTGMHLDGEGYELTARSDFFPGSTLNISNRCFYPKPQILNLDSKYCLNSGPITLEGSVGNGVEGSGTFKVNGVETTVFDPAALGPGAYLVEFSWNAGNPASELQPENVGCIESITQAVQVSQSTPNFSCNDLVRVNASSECTTLVTPDMIINGNLACLDDYFVRIYIPGRPGYLPNPIPAEFFGRTLNVIVEHLPSGNFCESQLIMEDKTPPVIECPGEVFEFACTDYDSIFNKEKAFAAIGFDPITDIYDACHDRSDVSVNWTDQFVPSDNECDNVGKIVRTIDAVDAAGNVAQRCRITFLLKTPELQIDLIQRPFEWNICVDQPLPLDNNGNPNPRVSGAPYFINGFGDTIFVFNQSTCNFAVAYTDVVVPNCGLSYEVFRTWTLSDPCITPSVRQLVQVIKVKDKIPPVVSAADGGDLVFSTGPFDCTSAFRVPAPQIADCNETTYTVEVRSVIPATDIFGVIIPGKFDTITLNSSITGNSRNGYFAANVPVGEHYLVYKAVDDCDNTSELFWRLFEVKDLVAPVAICGDDINFSVGGNGIGQLLVEDVNQGSRDNCGQVELAMRREIDQVCLDAYVTDVIGRQVEGALTLNDLDKIGNEYFFNDELVIVFENGKYYSSYSERLYFFCCDVGTSVNVQLLVTDGSGNSNFCWINIAVEDKVPPLVIPPSGITATCDTLTFGITDLTDTLQLQQKFGNALASDNCRSVTFELPPQVSLNNCGVGQIIRKFRARDASGNLSGIAQQVIDVIAKNSYEIKFPADALSAQCGVFEADTLEFKELACDQLLVNVEDDRFSASGDECYKILRTYQVINWCEHNGIDGPVTISRDEDGDGIPGEEIYLLRRRNRVYLDNNNDETDGFIKEVTSIGFWKYTQIINVYDTEDPQIDFTAPDEPFCSYGDTQAGCESTVKIDFGVADGCSPNELKVEVFLEPFRDSNNRILKSGTDEVRRENGRYLFEGKVPLGEHRLYVRVTDACGNISTAQIPFELVDCKVAGPVCKGITAEIMPMDTDNDQIPDTGMAIVPARAFLASIDSLNDCSGPLTYSIHRKGATVIDPGQKELVLTCADSTNVAIPVLIYVWDQAYNPLAIQPDGSVGGPNYSLCETFVVLEDNLSGICDERSLVAISGGIRTEEGRAIEGAMVKLSGIFSDSVYTDIDGAYMFEELETNYDYSIRPELSHDYRNGVSTIDMVLISKHILGTERLPSPYRMIAADINNSGSVSTFDLIQMRKLILALEDEFSNNSSWRFIDATYDFPNETNPWLKPLKEVVNFNNIDNDQLSADFVGVKIGDVNLNAKTSSLVHAPRAEGGTLELEVHDRELSPGQTVEVQLTSQMLSNIMGYQFTFEFDPGQLELKDIHYGTAREGDFGFRYVADGLITSSWHPQDQVDETQPLFSLVFKARGYGLLSEAIGLNSRLTQAEAYNFSQELMDVRLRFVGEASISDGPVFSLEQNQPNPFNNRTVIGFTLPEAGQASLSIFDANGRTVKYINGYFGAGENRVELNSTGLPAGVLYYRLESGPHQAIRKMILLE